MLDLGSNLIEKIQGLKKLVSLKELTLRYNKLEHIEGLETQAQSLEILDIDNNMISDE